MRAKPRSIDSLDTKIQSGERDKPWPALTLNEADGDSRAMVLHDAAVRMAYIDYFSKRWPYRGPEPGTFRRYLFYTTAKLFAVRSSKTYFGCQRLIPLPTQLHTLVHKIGDISQNTLSSCFLANEAQIQLILYMSRSHAFKGSEAIDVEHDICLQRRWFFATNSSTAAT